MAGVSRVLLGGLVRRMTLAAVMIIVAAVAAVSYGLVTWYDAAWRDRQGQTDLIVSKRAALDVAPALFIKQKDSIERKLRGLIDDSGSDLLALDTFDADFQPLTTHQTANAPTPAMIAGKLAQMADRLKAGDLIRQPLATGLMVLVPAKLVDGQIAGYMVVVWSTEAIEAVAQRALKLVVGGVIGAALLCMATIIFLTKLLVVRPTDALAGYVVRLAEGDLWANAPADCGPDLARMAKAVGVLHDRMTANAEMEQARDAERLQSDQRRTRREAASREFASVIDRIVGDLSHSVDQLHEAANTFSEGAASTRSHSAQAIQSTDSAADNVAIIAELTRDLVVATEHIGDQAAAASSITRDAVGLAASMQDRVRTFTKTVSAIGSVANLIDQIAGQTNLLALNATIEAARAGEAGKGFAVVASEVKQLAGATSRATDEIRALLVSVESDAESTVTAMSDVVSTIGKISEVSQAVADTLISQRQNADSIASSVDVARQATATAHNAVTTVIAVSEETHRQSSRVGDAVATLRDRTATLGQSVSGFVTQVNAG